MFKGAGSRTNYSDQPICPGLPSQSRSGRNPCHPGLSSVLSELPELPRGQGDSHSRRARGGESHLAICQHLATIWGCRPPAALAQRAAKQSAQQPGPAHLVLGDLEPRVKREVVPTPARTSQPGLATSDDYRRAQGPERGETAGRNRSACHLLERPAGQPGDLAPPEHLTRDVSPAPA